jgi:hypothetical protein
MRASGDHLYHVQIYKNSSIRAFGRIRLQVASSRPTDTGLWSQGMCKAVKTIFKPAIDRTG